MQEKFKKKWKKPGLIILVRERPEGMINRHPFPGPGLLVRLVGCFKREYLDVLKHANKIVEENLKDQGFSQYFAAVSCQQKNHRQSGNIRCIDGNAQPLCHPDAGGPNRGNDAPVFCPAYFLFHVQTVKMGISLCINHNDGTL
jgi:hypothetical protein